MSNYYNLEEEIRILENEERRLTMQLQVTQMQLKTLREKRML